MLCTSPLNTDRSTLLMIDTLSVELIDHLAHYWLHDRKLKQYQWRRCANCHRAWRLFCSCKCQNNIFLWQWITFIFQYLFTAMDYIYCSISFYGNGLHLLFKIHKNSFRFYNIFEKIYNKIWKENISNWLQCCSFLKPNESGHQQSVLTVQLVSLSHALRNCSN